MTTFRKQVGTALERLRNSRGWTQAEVAKQTRRVRAEHLSRYESEGKLQLSTLAELLDVLGANLCDLAREMDAPPESAPEETPAPPESSCLIGDPRAVSLAVAYLRQRRGLDTEALSVKVGVTDTAAKGYESGRPMRLSTLERILDALEYSLFDFHEALVLAHSVLAWQGEAEDETAHLRYCLQRLGSPHLGSTEEHRRLVQLAKMRTRLQD